VAMKEEKPKQRCATCLTWRMALGATAIMLLVSWLGG